MINRWGSDLAALCAGLALPLAFAPFSLAPIGILAPAILFYLWLGDSPARAAWHGFLFGLGMFGVGVSWVYVSLHDFGNMGPLLAGLAVVLFVGILAAYPAFLGWLQGRFAAAGMGIRSVLVLPALWVFLEWVRSWLFTGFPWLSLGYSQIDTPLAALAVWLGVYGVTLATVLTAGFVAWLLREPKTAWRFCVPALLSLWALAWVAGETAWVRPAGAPLKVAVIQGNVPLAMKWEPGRRRAIIDRYLELNGEQDAGTLVVWPEAAVPSFLHELDPDFWERVQRREGGTIFGVLERRGSGPEAIYYNSVVGVDHGRGLYRKRHLVPFGEYPALPLLTRWLMASLQIPMSDFTPWEGAQGALGVAGQKIAVSICYEDAFPEEIIRFLPEATLLVNVSEDAWFGDSLGPHQRLQMARMRALETGRGMVRAANTGISAVIDHRGELVARTEQFVTTVLRAKVQPMRGATPYVHFGNGGILILVAGMLGGAVTVSRRRRRSRSVST